MPSPLPPWTSGSESPSQPSCAISFHIASLSPRGSSHEARTVAGLQCSSRNARAEFFRSCWSDVNPKSMALGLHPVGADLLGQTKHALADHVLLDLRRAGVNRAGPRPQVRRGPRAIFTGRRIEVVPVVVGRQELTGRAEDLQGRLVVALLELGVRILGQR